MNFKWRKIRTGLWEAEEPLFGIEVDIEVRRRRDGWESYEVSWGFPGEANDDWQYTKEQAVRACYETIQYGYDKVLKPYAAGDVAKLEEISRYAFGSVMEKKMARVALKRLHKRQRSMVLVKNWLRNR